MIKRSSTVPTINPRPSLCILGVFIIDDWTIYDLRFIDDLFLFTIVSVPLCVGELGEHLGCLVKTRLQLFLQHHLEHKGNVRFDG